MRKKNKIKHRGRAARRSPYFYRMSSFLHSLLFTNIKKYDILLTMEYYRVKAMGQEKSSKIRLFKIWEILRAETDEDNPMNTPTILRKLSESGIDCDRRTLYKDIQALNDFGYEILHTRGISNEYYVVDRSFDVPELRILLDAVQAASFITPKKTDALVDKIAALAGSHRAELLKNNIMRFNVTKHTNESIYYSVNEIERAIIEGKKVSFFYFDYNAKGERVFRKEKKRYVVNPYATVFSNDNYYLVCYSDKYKNMTHYRIDRMDTVEVEQENITPAACVKGFDITEHKKQVFGMFVGKEERVSITIDNSLIDPVMDKFGEDVKLVDRGDGTAQLDISVQISPAFIAWCCSFGDKLTVVYPKPVVEQVSEYVKALAQKYKDKGE